MSKHPMQPIDFDAHKTARFKGNAIVKYLLDNGGIDLNALAMMKFSKDDRTQFAQLIGYSVSGAGDLPYFDRKILERADTEVSRLLKL